MGKLDGGGIAVSLLVERSLLKIGQSLAVTLPKAWIRDHQLKAGDQVQIDRLGINDSLVIKARRRGEKRQKVYT